MNIFASLFVSHTHDSDSSSNKGVALVEQTSSQVVRPASVEVAALLGEGGSNSQEARPASEEGELIFCKDISNTYWCGRCSNTSLIRLHP